VLALFTNSDHPYSSLFSSSDLCLAPFLGSLIVLRLQNHPSTFRKITVLYSAKPFWQNYNILSCIFNHISKNITQQMDCCIIVGDQFMSLGCTAALFPTTTRSVSKMAKGRKRHQSSTKSTDESHPSQKGQEEEIATPI
jgi:hypothetical protein